MFRSVRIQLESAYSRITLTRIRLFFFLLAFVHCAALVFLQSVLFVLNAEARDLMIHIMQTTGARRDSLAVVSSDPLALFLCQTVPSSAIACGFSAKDYEDVMKACTQVSPPMNASSNVGVEKRILFSTELKFIPDIRNTSIVGLSIVGTGSPEGIRDPDGNLWLSDACTVSLRYPEQQFQDAERENVSFLFFHIWLLVISVAALTSESIPHLASAVAGQVLSTSYSTWDIFRTLNFQNRYSALVEDTLCGGADLLPNYWRLRNQFNVSIACINWGALAIGAWLSLRLLKTYLTANFRSVGSAPTIERIYRVLLAFSTVLRLFLFFVVLSTALWIDQIDGGLMHTFLSGSQYDGYLGICSIALIVAIPVAVMGEYAMRTERRKLAIGFFCAQTLFLGFHASLLASSPIYRWTLIVWPFFALNVASSFILAAVTLALAIVCRRNFGRGLDHYLHVTAVLEQTGFTRALMPSETAPARAGRLDEREPVKFPAIFRSSPKKPRPDSMESFGQTSRDTFDDELDEKFPSMSSGAAMPVFNNRAAVRVPDSGGASGHFDSGDV